MLYFSKKKNQLHFFVGLALSMKNSGNSCLSWSLHCRNAHLHSANYAKLFFGQAFPSLTCVLCECAVGTGKAFLTTLSPSLRHGEEWDGTVLLAVMLSFLCGAGA